MPYAPRVSAAITAINQPALLIDSDFAQTYPRYKIIVARVGGLSGTSSAWDAIIAASYLQEQRAHQR